MNPEVWGALLVGSSVALNAILVRAYVRDRFSGDKDSEFNILNRRGFDRQLAWANGSRSNAVLIFMDLDHLKTINDTHGHAVGDKAIAAMVRVTKDGIRGSDSFGRIGGDEFFVILRRTDLKDAKEIIERLHGDVRSANVGTTTDIFLSASLGIAQKNFGESVAKGRK